MADYRKLFDRKKKFLELLDERLKVAEESKYEAQHAATSIQRVFRGVVRRMEIARLSYTANEIQRVFRGHMGRQKANEEAGRKRTRRNLYYINYLCIQLQRCFRGYYSRKYKQDHSRRKQYCRFLEDKHIEVLNQMNQYAFEQAEREADILREKRQEEFTNLAKNLHHLLSTRHIRGVYNPIMHLVEPPTMGQRPVEDHIRGVVKDLLRTRGITKRGLVADINGTLKIPLKINKNRLSLQASVPYDTVRKEQLKEKLIHRIITADKGNFLAGGTTRLIDHNETPNAVGEPFLDAWANPMLVKGVPKDQKQLMESARTQKALFAAPVSKPFLTRVGGNKSSTLANDIFDIIAEAEETGGAAQRHLGTGTARFGLASSVDSRSAAVPDSFHMLPSSQSLNGLDSPSEATRMSASMRSTQRRVKNYTFAGRSRPVTQTTVGVNIINKNSIGTLNEMSEESSNYSNKYNGNNDDLYSSSDEDERADFIG